MTKQLDNLIAYIDNDPNTGLTYCDRIYFKELLEQCLLFEAENRTKSDLVVAAMIALCCALEPAPVEIKPKTPIIRTFN
jgi:hypothetical protein